MACLVRGFGDFILFDLLFIIGITSQIQTPL